MKHQDYEPDWYKREMERIELESERRNKTWGHPMDWVLAIGFVSVLVAVVKGWI